MTMLEDFVFWIKSIVEDDPIPYEIKNIYFCLVKNKKAITLMLGGRETDKNCVCDFEYFPLEAQYFFNRSFNEIGDLYLAKLAAKNLIEESLFDKDILGIFKGKTVFVGEFMKSPEYAKFID